MLEIKNFSCGYGQKTIIKDFNAIFQRGDITAISGNSGAGKTTILKAINRLHEVEDNEFFQAGSIKAKFDNKIVHLKDINPVILRKNIGYIFQSPTPLPLSIYQNIKFGLKLHKIKDKNIIYKVLKQVGLYDEVKDRLDKSANILSLGQQQRLSIARVLVLDPKILLFDEPTSSLDLESALKIESLIKKLKKDKIIILVTHNNTQIDRICNKVINFVA